MIRHAVCHISGHVSAYPLSDKILRVRLRTAKGDCAGVRVCYKNVYDHTDSIQTKTMDIIAEDELFAYYETDIDVKEGYFKYYFELMTDQGILRYTQAGFVERNHEDDYFYYAEAHESDVFHVPMWAEEALVYQILIDRFQRSELVGKDHVNHRWTEKPDRETYYGGDFHGVIEKLPHLCRMNVDVIYLSPVFKSPTYHKYDIIDFYEIEKVYGGESGLRALIRSAHEQGIRVMLDGVFNHCSWQHPMFLDVLDKQKKSRYASWFKIEAFPVSTERMTYKSFGNLVPEMPKFNTCNPEVIDYLTEVAAYWTRRLDIDGWRLDVADEISSEFWRVFRRKLKDIDENILILGEAWNVSTRWMQGDQFDTMTNYKFRDDMVAFMSGDIDSYAFIHRFHRNRMHYKSISFPGLVNVLGSHDTERIRHVLNSREKVSLALRAMLLFEGMSMVYYGDEYYMDGGEDPDNRRAMTWDENDDLVDDLARLTECQKEHPVLKHGEFCFNDCHHPRVLSFRRSTEKETFTIIINASENPFSIRMDDCVSIYGHPSTSCGHYQIEPYELIVLQEKQKI